MAAHKLFQGNALDVGQAAQSGIGEEVAAGPAQQGGGVGEGGDKALPFQGGDGVVDRAVGDAGDGGQLQPVQEGHGRQPPQGLQVKPSGTQQETPPDGEPPGELGLRVRARCCPPDWPVAGVWGGSAPLAFCRSASSLRYSLTFCSPSALAAAS